MVRSDVPRCGDVYWIDPNPVAGREMKDRHRFVVITPRQVNALGVSMTVPITTGGAFARGREHQRNRDVYNFDDASRNQDLGHSSRRKHQS